MLVRISLTDVLPEISKLFVPYLHTLALWDSLFTTDVM